MSSPESGDNKCKDWVVHVLAIVFCFAYVALEIAAALKQVSVDEVHLRDLYSLALLVASYYFGSSYKRRK